MSYPAHVILRYEIERALIDGDIEVDYSGAVGRKDAALAGDFPPRATIATSCMQDITGPTAFWLFPFLYAWARCMPLIDGFRQIGRYPQLESDIANGNFSALFDWLRQNICGSTAAAFTTSQLILHRQWRKRGARKRRNLVCS